MRIRRLSLVVLLLLVPTTARAHDHFADVCLAFSDAVGSQLLGPHITFAKTIPPMLKVQPTKLVSVVVDFSTNWGSHGDTDLRLVNFMSGVRYTFARDVQQQALPFVQVLVGGVHAKDGAEGDAEPALAFGVGFDYLLRDAGRFGVRVQSDYLVHHGDITPRVSLGFVVRIDK